MKTGLRKGYNTHTTIRAYLGLAKTRELMHDGGEMTYNGHRRYRHRRYKSF